jgi:ferredoxin-NADP reductase
VGSIRRIHIPTAASPLDGPSWIRTVSFTPKGTQDGCLSDFLNERALPGLAVRASGPAGKFYFDEKVDRDIVLIAAGSDITPMIAMLRYMEERALDVPATNQERATLPV